MPRTMRVQYPGATYHVMNRGDRQENIFVDGVDRQDFLKTLAEGCRKTGWRMHACCLMKNHFHLLPIKWIAARLQMGSSKSVKSMLHHWMHVHEKPATNDPRCPQLQ